MLSFQESVFSRSVVDDVGSFDMVEVHISLCSVSPCNTSAMQFSAHEALHVVVNIGIINMTK